MGDSTECRHSHGSPCCGEDQTSGRKSRTRTSLHFMKDWYITKRISPLSGLYPGYSSQPLLAIVFPLIHMFSNPSTMIRTLIILGRYCRYGRRSVYAWISDVPLNIPGYKGTDNSDPHTLKLVDMGLISTYFILGLTMLSILYSEIAKYFK